MKSKVLFLIIIATVPVVGLSVWAVRRDAARVEAKGVQGPLFPGLDAAGQGAGAITSIKIQRGEKPYTISRDATSGEWFLPGRSNYPAKLDKARALVQSLVNATIVDERTSDPSKHELIGVQDAGVRGENGMFSGLVELLDNDAKSIASIIVGQAKSQTGFVIDAQRQQVYVRRPGEARSWLVTGPIEVDPDDLAWADRETINVQKERVKSATITRADGQRLAVSRENATAFTLLDLPPGRELRSPGALDQVASVLSFMTFEDVRPAADIDFSTGADPAASGTIRVECLDGLVIEAAFAKKEDGKTWVKLTPSFDVSAATSPATTHTPADKLREHKGPKTAEEAKNEAETIQIRFAPWAYQMSDYKSSSFIKTMEDLLKPAAGATPTDMPEGIEPMQLPPGLPPMPEGPGEPVGPTPPAEGPKR
jgi:Domain of unknown function (DUF4340)